MDRDRGAHETAVSSPRAVAPGACGFSAGELGGMLRAQARGVHAGLAAAELLIAHGHWIERGDFVARFVRVAAAPSRAGDRPVAWIDWDDVADVLRRDALACSSGERAMLLIAASLAGELPVTLGRLLGGLDRRNIALVAEAVLHANGTVDATVVVPAASMWPAGVRVLGAGGQVLQEGGTGGR
jgi:hypothetical protein